MAQKSCIQDGRYVPGDQRKAKLKAAAQLYARRPSVEHKVRGLRTAAKWETDGLLDFNDRMEEGFAARYSKELLVFDMAKDRRLNKFMRNLKAEVSRMGSGERQRILHVSRAVDRTFGGSSNEVPRDLERKIRELDLAKGDNLYIGHLMQKSDEAGAGLCRHRTLLFKYTMDRLNAEGLVGQCAAVVGVMVSKGTTDVARFRKNMGWADHAWPLG
ncbi:unnamed protein product [Effrenium voratum]|nr:unnamed protein product [Effrenium voratum]